MSSERRTFPRHSADFPVTVTLPDTAEAFLSQVNNLSRTSVQITCHADLIAALIQQATLPLLCKVDFTIPGHSHNFIIPSQVVTHRRLSQYQYALVLLFRHEDAHGEDLLDQMMDASLPVRT